MVLRKPVARVPLRLVDQPGRHDRMVGLVAQRPTVARVDPGRHGRLGAGERAVPGDRLRRVVAGGHLAPRSSGRKLVPKVCAARDGQPPFAHLAAQLGAVLLGLVTAAGVAATLLELPRIPVGRLDWIALAGIVTATAVCLRERRARFPLPTLYCLGLSAVGLGLLARQLTPRMFCWSAVDELAGYALAAAAIAWLYAHAFRPGCSPSRRSVRWTVQVAFYQSASGGYRRGRHAGLMGHDRFQL